MYLLEGDTAKAVLNLTSLIPGDKLGKYVVKNGRKIATVTAITAVICQTDAGAGLKHELTNAGNEIVEFYGLDDMSAMDYLFMGIYGFRFAKGAKGGLLDIDLPSSNKAPEVEIAGTGVTVTADSFDDVLYRADDAGDSIAPADAGKGGIVYQNVFPENPDEFLPEIQRNKVVKSNGTTCQIIYTSDNVRVRAEQHPLLPGEQYNPRHHGIHYHVEYKIDSSKSWNNRNNIMKCYSEDYIIGNGTGFIPGEKFPK